MVVLLIVMFIIKMIIISFVFFLIKNTMMDHV